VLDEAVAALSLLAAPGRRVVAHTCDVSSAPEIEQWIRFARESLGEPDVLVANAGVYGPMGPTDEVDLVAWEAALRINLLGVLLPCRAVMPGFKRRRAGRIIVISGGGATNPMPNVSAYAASKAAVVRLMETLAEELRDFGVDVNAIAPGALRTRLIDEVLRAGPEKVGQAFFEKNRKWAAEGATDPTLAAGLAVYLASPASRGITGRLISAQWDPWRTLHEHREELSKSDIYCLRRIVPEDRGRKW
jgi:NAD(P)-dependent dehydrogenase (short-subunit alcohol dehydrogenase family)